MAGRKGPGPTMLQSGNLPQPDPLPVGTANNESEYFQKDRRLLMEVIARAYEEHGLQGKAYRAAGVTYDTFHRWLKHDAWFQARMEDAQQVRRDKYESMIDSRLEDPTGNRGSDILLMFRSKAEWPDKYRDEQKVTIDQRHAVSVKFELDGDPRVLAYLKAQGLLSLPQAEGSRLDGAVEGQVVEEDEGEAS